jgi:serine/threonine protein kinase
MTEQHTGSTREFEDTEAEPSRPSGSAFDRGELIGRYVVLDKLGAGAMGVVFAAYDPQLDRKVALKLLLSSTGGPAELRLQREAQALAKLDHPNVVSVHDVGMHEQQLFVAMEFVEGRDLAAWIARSTDRIRGRKSCRCTRRPGAGSRPHMRSVWCTVTSSPPT